MSGRIKKRVAVIGAGPSGMMAAIQASRGGCGVTVFEKQKKTGRKLSITGNGQCNISNRFPDQSRYHGENPGFVHNIFSRFGAAETEDFFAEIGVPFIEKKQGKLYPCSLQAQSVVDILEYEMRRAGVNLQLHRRVDSIDLVQSGVEIQTAGLEKLKFDSVILAAGGCAYPQLGASRQGYDLAVSLGHTLNEPFPAILPINIPLRALHRLEGIKWDVSLSVVLRGKVTARSEGELLFTRYGISGPAALEISRFVNGPLIRGQSPKIVLNIFPDHSRDGLVRMMDQLMSIGDRSVSFALLGVLKRRMPDVFMTLAGVDPSTPCINLTAAQKDKIIGTCTALALEPGEVRPFSEAVIAAGGINVDEVAPSTMESKKAKGVFLCGEILDIDGDSGGYNLQFAWSTGAIAGMSQ